jgi:hypothetical protein
LLRPESFIGLPKWLFPLSFDGPILTTQSTINSPGPQQQITRQGAMDLETKGAGNLADLEVEQDILT